MLDDAFGQSSARASVVGLVMSSGCRTSVRFRRGNLCGAQADAETCLELAVEAGLARFVRMAVAVLVAVFVEQGRLDEAQAALDRLTVVAINDSDGPPGGTLLRESRGWLSLARAMPTACGTPGMKFSRRVNSHGHEQPEWRYRRARAPW